MRLTALQVRLGVDALRGVLPPAAAGVLPAPDAACRQAARARLCSALLHDLDLAFLGMAGRAGLERSADTIADLVRGGANTLLRGERWGWEGYEAILAVESTRSPGAMLREMPLHYSSHSSLPRNTEWVSIIGIEARVMVRCGVHLLDPLSTEQDNECDVYYHVGERCSHRSTANQPNSSFDNDIRVQQGGNAGNAKTNLYDDVQYEVYDVKIIY